jgi:hypothetical protein
MGGSPNCTGDTRFVMDWYDASGPDAKVHTSAPSEFTGGACPFSNNQQNWSDCRDITNGYDAGSSYYAIEDNLYANAEKLGVEAPNMQFDGIPVTNYFSVEDTEVEVSPARMTKPVRKALEVKFETPASVIKRENAAKRAERKDAMPVMTAAEKSSMRASQNATSATKHRAIKQDRMSFLLENNALLEHDITMLIMEIDKFENPHVAAPECYDV